ncbi:hypothetical protein BH10ACT1_BH10ACT1_08150 [soil metagenome]
MTIQGSTPASHAEDSTEMATNGRRDLMKKLAVGGAIVWAAPAIASTAGAQAAASDVGGGGGPGHTPGSFTIAAVGGTIGGVTISRGGSSFLNATAGPNNRDGSSLSMVMSTTRTAAGSSRQVISYSFSAPVTNISFTVSNYDATSETVTATGGTYTTSGSTRVVQIAGPVSFFQIAQTLLAPVAAGSSRSVVISGITFTP